VAAGPVYKLDLNTPARLVFVHPYGPPNPDRVDVFRTGPKTGIDATATHLTLPKRSATYSVTNRAEINELVSALRQNDDSARVVNEPTLRGFTYHLLLFDNDRQTVMHFRVFEPSGTNTQGAVVFPRSDSGFGYGNSAIVKWLYSHARFGTNSAGSSVERQKVTNLFTPKEVK